MTEKRPYDPPEIRWTHEADVGSVVGKRMARLVGVGERLAHVASEMDGLATPSRCRELCKIVEWARDEVLDVVGEMMGTARPLSEIIRTVAEKMDAEDAEETEGEETEDGEESEEKEGGDGDSADR